MREEEAIVLDFLPNGYPFEEATALRTPIVQAIGKSNFTLLELVPKKGVYLNPEEEVYIGEGKREKIMHIKGKLDTKKLTQTAKSVLEHAVEKLVTQNEKRFVQFFNTAKPLSTRMHQIELLPGLGKKHMWQVIEEREIRPFTSFEDIKERISLLPDPKKLIVKRILKEFEGKQQHTLFVDLTPP
ncbi:MAG: DUF655 domain-containing protein, partial [Candidatus Woesearchaeota archaeon]